MHGFHAPGAGWRGNEDSTALHRESVGDRLTGPLGAEGSRLDHRLAAGALGDVMTDTQEQPLRAPPGDEGAGLFTVEAGGPPGHAPVSGGSQSRLL